MRTLDLELWPPKSNHIILESRRTSVSKCVKQKIPSRLFRRYGFHKVGPGGRRHYGSFAGRSEARTKKTAAKITKMADGL